MIKQFWYINHIDDYQVVDLHLIYKYNIMKVKLLLKDCNEQVSLMSESITETRVNLNLTR
jgi:hypothetical protein